MPEQPSMPALTVRALRAVPVEIPPTFLLSTSQGGFTRVPLLLIDLETEEGVTGRSYLFCFLRAAVPGLIGILGEIEAQTKGERLDPAALWAKLTRRFTLIGVQGIVRAAMSGVNGSIYYRLPFTLSNAVDVSKLTFRAKYDDGFAAFLNGLPVLSANGPATPAWNSAA